MERKCFHGGGGIPACTGADTPTWAVHAGIHRPGRHPLGQTTPPPLGIHSPWAHPPPAATAVDGTHPTGMHSCFILVLDYSEFGNNEHLALTQRFLCIKITDGNSKKFVYNEHICLTSVTRAKCGIRSTLCWKIGNISGSTELFTL